MNADIRGAAKAANVKLWQIAEELGIADFTLSRRLRHELSEQQKVEVFEAIQAISTRKEG